MQTNKHCQVFIADASVGNIKTGPNKKHCLPHGGHIVVRKSDGLQFWSGENSIFYKVIFMQSSIKNKIYLLQHAIEHKSM